MSDRPFFAEQMGADVPIMPAGWEIVAHLIGEDLRPLVDWLYTKKSYCPVGQHDCWIGVTVNKRSTTYTCTKHPQFSRTVRLTSPTYPRKGRHT